MHICDSKRLIGYKELLNCFTEVKNSGTMHAPDASNLCVLFHSGQLSVHLATHASKSAQGMIETSTLTKYLQVVID